MRAFQRFLKASNITARLPLETEVVAAFIAWMTGRPKPNLAASTMRGYLCGLRDGVQRRGFPDPFANNWVLQRLFRAAKIKQARPVRRRVAVTQPLLQLMLQALEAIMPTDHVLRTTLAFAWCLSFTLLLRHGELCPKATAATSSFPQMSWFRVESPDLATFNLPASKTDVFRAGVSLPCLRSNTSLCPVTRFLEMMVACPAKEQRGPNTPLLRLADGSPLSRDVSMSALKECGKWLNRRYQLGIDVDGLGNASFRRGGASWLHECGVPDAAIMELGRWRSNAYRLYIDRPLSTLRAVQRHLWTPASSALARAQRWLRGSASNRDFNPRRDEDLLGL